MAASAVKTTFLLSASRRARLKALAAERDTTVAELLTEGVDLVLETYARKADRQTLLQRAREAKRRLRCGFYSDRGLTSEIDNVVYFGGAELKAPRRH